MSMISNNIDFYSFLIFLYWQIKETAPIDFHYNELNGKMHQTMED